MFKHLIVAVDFSEPSRAALEVAMEIAQRSRGASITLLHLYGVPAHVYGEGVAFPASILAQLASEAFDEVAKLCAAHAKEGVALRPVAQLGTPMDIVGAAESENADLIVMGTHGRTGLPHLLLGSFAERVVRMARCPVLTVRGPTLGTRKAEIRRILVATDLTDTSRKAMREAVKLGQQFGAEVIGLHVAEPIYSTSRFNVELARSESEMLEALRVRQREASHTALQTHMNEALAAASPSVATRTVVWDGIPADMIVTAAAEFGADLIVMGTHGRTGTQHLLLGSIAERVVRTAPIPVLTVRPDPA